MNTETNAIVADFVQILMQSWNNGDGAAFASVFADNAEFVNIRGDLIRTRQAIAAGHQQIFDTIYQGSTLHYDVVDSRALTGNIMVAHIAGTMHAPIGPMAGTNYALATLVLVQTGEIWQIASFHNTLKAQH